MEDSENLSATELDLERALAELAPAPPAFGMRELAFRAGQADGRRQVNRWRVVAAAALVVCVWSVAGWMRPAGVQVDRVVLPAESEGVGVGAAPRTTATYLRLRDDLVRYGWDALRPGAGGGNVEPSVRVVSMD